MGKAFTYSGPMAKKHDIGSRLKRVFAGAEFEQSLAMAEKPADTELGFAGMSNSAISFIALCLSKAIKDIPTSIYLSLGLMIGNFFRLPFTSVC